MREILRHVMTGLGVAFVALMVAGCIPTAENPIVTKGGGLDQALIGTWHGTGHDGPPLYIHFLRRDDAMLGAIMVMPGEDPQSSGEWSVYRLVTGTVKGQRYMSVLWDTNNGNAVEGREKGYHLVRYDLHDGKLSLFLVNEEKLKEAVKAGSVAGAISEDNEVRVTASSEKLVTFLKKTDPKDLFDHPFATLTRVGG